MPTRMGRHTASCLLLISLLSLITIAAGHEVQIETPDNYCYKYLEDHGVTIKGYTYITFLLKAASDGHVTLSTYKNSSYEIVIGANGNTRSDIRQCPTCGDAVSTTHLSGILSNEELRPFWISWAQGHIRVGKGRQLFDKQFLSWTDSDPHQINHVGISTGWGSKGTWIFVGRDVQIETPDNYHYKYLEDHGVIVKGNTYITFLLKAANDGHVALSTYKNCSSSYEIVIGASRNRYSDIRQCHLCGNKVSATHSSGILSNEELRPFWISWAQGHIRVGKGTQPFDEQFLSWTFSDPHQINHVGISTGFGSSGTWIFVAPQCGIQDSLYPPNSERIVGGREANPYSWPWQVALYKYSDRHLEFKYHCGGSIISHRYVLTAAHCVTDTASDYRIVAGEHDRNINEGTEQTIAVAAITKHKDFVSVTKGNDIALLRLAEDIRYTLQVKPVCLPRGDVATNTACTTTGWGATLGTGDTMKLNEVSVPIMDRAFCRRNNVYGIRFTNTMICAGYREGGKDSCSGDSGGPLVCRGENGVYHQYGITSWGYNCALPRKPGVYTRVSLFVDWIASKTSGAFSLGPAGHHRP